MPKQNIDELTDFGRRRVPQRKASGYTQVELAKELEMTQRQSRFLVINRENHNEFNTHH